ncbi:MAG: M2 family metallopeptidase [Deltaproteobacteria bacterium]|nr:M2 family metallopeptidase [Deltaproteobacteria bacterium]
MKNIFVFFSAVIWLSSGCTKTDNSHVDTPDKSGDMKNTDQKGDNTVKPPQKIDWKAKASAYLDDYNKKVAELYRVSAIDFWNAAISGKTEDFAKAGASELAFKKFHSSKAEYSRVVELLKNAKELDEITKRSLLVIELAFRENLLPTETLKSLVDKSKEIEKVFNTYRGTLGKNKKEYSNNQLLGMLRKEKNSKKRQQIWEALKGVGAAVAPKLIELAKIRNSAAISLGYKDFWHMRIILQEHDPATLVTLFTELEKLTNEPFRTMKDKLDKELAKRFRVKASKMMPWHYDNPFFQEAPPSARVNLDEFFKKMKKEDIVGIAKKFYDDLDLNADDIIARSDYYEKKGKDQHAFCTTIDRLGDVRMLLNITPSVYWMDTMLHEAGHAVYYKYIDRKLPWTLREAAHIFTTEAVAMYFGALSKNTSWLIEYAKAKPARVKKLENAIIEQRIREQLIFARWTLVMFNFEKALYSNPSQDLNKLWWDMVEKYQMLTRPAKRNSPDWASKPHFTIAPVYYHNYMMGELFAAQLRDATKKLLKSDAHPSQIPLNKSKELGKFMKEKIFAPGYSYNWVEFVKRATGSELSSKYFAEEVKMPVSKSSKK